MLNIFTYSPLVSRFNRNQSRKLSPTSNLDFNKICRTCTKMSCNKNVFFLKITLWYFKRPNKCCVTVGAIRATHYFDLRAVSQLLDRVHVLRVVLQENGHLKRGRLHTHTQNQKCLSKLIYIDGQSMEPVLNFGSLHTKGVKGTKWWNQKQNRPMKPFSLFLHLFPFVSPYLFLHLLLSLSPSLSLCIFPLSTSCSLSPSLALSTSFSISLFLSLPLSLSI